MNKLGIKSTRKFNKGVDAKEALTGYFFVAPYLLLFLVFTGIPFFIAFGLSFVNVKYLNQINNIKFVGLDNFIMMFKNPEVMGALGRTFLYSFLYVPLIMIVGFVLAYLLNKSVFFKKGIRSMVFLPYVSNMMAVAVIFKLILGPRGPIFPVLQFLGLQKPLLLDIRFALPTVVVIAVWKSVGLNMLTYLGAMQEVSQELIEAAQIDGASKLKQITNVILPSLSPTTFFLLISSIITSLQNYTVIQSLTEGGPGQATTTMAISIIRTAFSKNNASYASAQALVVFFIVMIVTLIQWQGQRKWVNY